MFLGNKLFLIAQNTEIFNLTLKNCKEFKTLETTARISITENGNI